MSESGEINISLQLPIPVKKGQEQSTFFMSVN